MKNYELKTPIITKSRKSLKNKYLELISNMYDKAVESVVREAKQECYKNRQELIKDIE